MLFHRVKLTVPPNVKNTWCRLYGDHRIPERLLDVPNQIKPKFFSMVEYNFHKACVLIEDKLVKDLTSRKDFHLSYEEAKAAARGIYIKLETCDYVFHVRLV